MSLSHLDIVLVVEDDVDLRDSLCAVLRDQGYTTAVASNGLEALSYLAQNPRPCVIVLDLMMPVMSGLEFRKRQLADVTLASIPTLVMSAMNQDPGHAELQGVAAYMLKPIHPADLMRTVRMYCPAA